MGMKRAIAGKEFIPVGGLDCSHLRVGPSETESSGIDKRRFSQQAAFDDLFMRIHDDRRGYRGLTEWNKGLGDAGCGRELQESGQ
jgi:hypothetical protein